MSHPARKSPRNSLGSGFLALVAGLMPFLAQATTAMELETRESGQPGRASVAVQEGKMRIEQGAGWMLYDSSKNSVFVVEPQRRSYLELNQDEMRRYGKQIGAARAMVDEQLKGLLPEQRAAIEKMMGGTTRREPLLFQSTSKRREIAGHGCTQGQLVRFNKTKNKHVVQEDVCLSAPKDIGMSEADYATVRKLYALMHEMQDLGAPGILPDFSEIDGVPIEVSNPNGDFQRLKGVTHTALPAQSFTVPPDYTREDVVQALKRYQQ